MSRSDRHADRVALRRHGVATVWIIASFPAMAVLLCLVLEVANLWMARVELRNALDAAALSAVKTWGEGGSTVAARTEGQVAAGLNTVTGSSVVLGLNTGGGTNGNGPNTGDILLGAISGTPGALTFDCNGTASCITGTVNLTIAVETNPAGDTFADPTTVSGDAETTFRVESFTQTLGVGAVLQSVEFDLSPMMITPVSGGGAGIPVPDDGFFDLRAIGAADVNFSIGNPTTKPALIGINDQAVVPTFTYSGGIPTQRTSALVSFGAGITPGAPGTNRFFFGTDTDQVGGDTGGGGGATAQDFGGEFGTDGGGGGGTDPFTSTGATVRVTVSGQTFTGTLTRINDDRSELVIVGNLTGGDSFGVRTSSTTQVNSICDTVFGTTVGPFNVTSIAYARFQCTAGPPELVRIQTFTCP